MTNLREAAQMALDALQESKPIDINDPTAFYRSAHAIEALRAALAQPEPEPVAWCFKESTGNLFGFTTELFDDEEQASNLVPLYTAPPQREWQRLTDEEQNQVAWSCGAMSADWLDFARAIEAKLKEKNT